MDKQEKKSYLVVNGQKEVISSVKCTERSKGTKETGHNIQRNNIFNLIYV